MADEGVYFWTESQKFFRLLFFKKVLLLLSASDTQISELRIVDLLTLNYYTTHPLLQSKSGNGRVHEDFELHSNENILGNSKTFLKNNKRRNF